MSNFSEEKVERAGDGKFAPKATSETEIDLGGGGWPVSVTKVHADGRFEVRTSADLPPEFEGIPQTALDAALRNDGLRADPYGENKAVATSTLPRGVGIEARKNVEKFQAQQLENVTGPNGKYALNRAMRFSRLGFHEPVSHVQPGERAIGLGRDVHGRTDVGEVDINAEVSHYEVAAVRQYVTTVEDDADSGAINVVLSDFGSRLQRNNGGRMDIKVSGVCWPDDTLDEAIRRTRNQRLSTYMRDNKMAADLAEYQPRHVQARNELIDRGYSGEAFDGFAYASKLHRENWTAEEMVSEYEREAS